VPNRRRRRLSTATSAFAALAVASPFAYIAVCDLTAKPAPVHHEFVRAASMTDLPGELMGALTQGLSQFGVSLPPIPSLTGATSPSSLGTPGLGSPDLASPGLTSPGLTSPGLASPGLTSPGLTSPGLTSPGLTSPGLTTPGLTPGATPGLTTPGLTPGATPGLTPGLTPGATPGLTSPGLTSPGLTPGLTSPNAFAPATGAGGVSNPSELPISDPVGLDPGAAGTYPILGDPSLGASPAPSGGLVSDMMSAANQLGAGQAIDLLKGMILPGLTQAAHGAAAPVPPPPAPAPIP
jgi:GLTT repeat (6 copies)